MINNRLYWLESSNLINDNQAGFWKGCRTEDQLFRFVQQTMDDFEGKRHTAAVFIDLQQAYDPVWGQGLFMRMRNMGIHGKMYKWIQAFLESCTTDQSAQHMAEQHPPRGHYRKACPRDPP